jgi:hypothetical protein
MTPGEQRPVHYVGVYAVDHFGINLPVNWIIYCNSTKHFYRLDAAALYTDTLATVANTDLTVAGIATAGWSLLGNAGTNPAINFLGTTDAQPLILRSNNVERMRFLSTGELGIGTIVPSSWLHIDKATTPTTIGTMLIEQSTSSENISAQTILSTLTSTSGVNHMAQHIDVVYNEAVTSGVTTIFGSYVSVVKSGADTTIRTDVIGVYGTGARTGSTDFGVSYVYGGYFIGIGDTAGISNVYGVYGNASGGDNNWSGFFENNIGISETASGEIITIIPNVATVSWTLALPDSGGTNTYLLQTDGSGITSWVAPSSLAADHSVLVNRDIAGNHAKLIPAADSTSSVMITKANATTQVLRADTTNNRIKIGNSLSTAPLQTLDIAGNFNFDAVADATQVQLNAITLTENLAGGTLAAAYYYYNVVFYTADGETGTSFHSTTRCPAVGVTTVNSSITLNNIPISSDPRVIGRKVYRCINSNLLGQEIATIADNVTTTFTDTGFALIAGTQYYRKANLTSGVFKFDNVKLIQNTKYITSMGVDAFLNLTTSNSCVAIGGSAGKMCTTSAGTYVGYLAGGAETTGAGTAFGYSALYGNQTGSNNVAIGSGAMRTCSITAAQNTAVGDLSLAGGSYAPSTTGTTALGYQAAMYSIGNCNTYVGWSSGKSASSVNNVNAYNVGVGYQSLNKITTSTATNNTAVGRDALYTQTTVANNIGLGAYSGKYETEGNKLFIDSLNRATEAAGRTNSIIYGVMNATPASQSLYLNSQVYLYSDSFKTFYGGGADMTIWYDGTYGQVKTSDVAASDLRITCGVNKTVELQNTVWDDIRVVPGSFDRPGSSDPTIIAYTPSGAGTSTWLYQFNKTNIASFTIQLPHGYKQGTDIYSHIHWTPGARGVAESGNTVGWKIHYTWANIDGAFGAMATLDLSDACNGVNHEHDMTPDVVINGHTAAKNISSMLICNVTRTDTGADDTWATNTSGNLPMLLEIDFHFEIDTLGSRQIGIK